MKRQLAGVVLVLALVSVLGAELGADDAAKPVDPAYEHLQKGRYAEALEAYERRAESKENADEAVIGISRALQAEGHWTKLTERLEQAVQDQGGSGRLKARLAEVYFLQGRHEQAEALAKNVIAAEADQLLARRVLADVLAETGRIDEADDAYRWFVRYYNRAQPDDAESLLLVAQGATQYARWNSVSQIFGFVVNTLCPDALKADPLCWQAYRVSGQLLLEKYNRAQALPEFQQALAINPRAAQVLVLLGEAALQKHALEKALQVAERALEINPQLVEALQLKADVLLRDGEISEALKAANQALAVNPRDQRTLARVAACYLLIDGEPPQAQFEKLVTNVDAVDQIEIDDPTRFENVVLNLAADNPHPGYFLTVLGETLEARRQYGLAETLFRRAVSLMPQLSAPKTALGMLYMRVGKTNEARKLLDEAFDADPFHVRVSNMRKVLKLLEGYEAISTEHFVIRVDSEQDRILGQYMAEFLESIYDDLVEQYGYEPPHRTQFEIYNKAKGLSAHQWFSARMVGLPWIQTIGASTGVIVALASPTSSDKPFNWARVLKHEFVHVLTLQKTRFNIPHWFTEALAVKAEGYPRPAVWNQLLLERVPKGELRDLDNLNDGFVRPESPLDWQFAYCQSRLYAEYMIETYGAESVAKLLDAYKENRSTDRAIQQVFDVDKEAFETGYRKFLEAIVADLQAGPAPGAKTPAEIEKAYRKRPDDPAAAAEFAHLLLKARKFQQARELAGKVLEQQASQPVAALVMAKLELRSQDRDAARTHLEAGLDRDAPHPELLTRLAKLTLLDDQYGQAEQLYVLGRRTFPHDADWLKGLAAVYLKTGEQDKLKETLAKIAAIDADDFVVRKKLAQIHFEQKDYAQAVRYGKEALYVNVLDPDVHKTLGAAFRKTKDWESAAHEFTVAVKLNPDDSDAELELAECLIAAGQEGKAKARLESLLEREPNNDRAKTLRNELE